MKAEQFCIIFCGDRDPEVYRGYKVSVNGTVIAKDGYDGIVCLFGSYSSDQAISVARRMLEEYQDKNRQSEDGEKGV